MRSADVTVQSSVVLWVERLEPRSTPTMTTIATALIEKHTITMMTTTITVQVSAHQARQRRGIAKSSYSLNQLDHLIDGSFGGRFHLHHSSPPRRAIFRIFRLLRPLPDIEGDHEINSHRVTPVKPPSEAPSTGVGHDHDPGQRGALSSHTSLDALPHQRRTHLNQPCCREFPTDAP
jgi:hypothetical protein